MKRHVRLTALLAVGVLMLAGTAAAWATFTTKQMTFVDAKRGTGLTVQVGQAASDAGHFIFVVDGRGSYEVSDRTAMTVHSDTSVTFQYAGPAQFRPDPDSGARFVASTVDIKFQAQVDPGHHTAEATLSELGGQFHLVVGAVGRGGIETTLRAFEDAVLRGDGRALYPILDSVLAAHYTTDEFARAMDAQIASAGRVVSLRRVSVSDVQYDDFGSVFMVVRYETQTASPSGTPATVLYDAYFVREGDAWRLWFTGER